MKAKETVIEYLAYIGDKFSHFFSLKLMVAGFFSVLCFLYDPLEIMALMGLFGLVCVDFVLGVSAAKYSGRPITSSKMRRGAIKLLVYFTMVAAGRMAEYALPAQLAIMDEAITAFLCVTELISILENCGLMGFAVPMKLLNQLHQFQDMANDSLQAKKNV